MTEPTQRRERIWRFARRKHPEGQILTPWLIAVRWVLFPLDTFYWKMSRTRGYNWDRDEWIINGVHYSGAAMRQLANSHGEVYRIERVGSTVSLRLVERAPVGE